MIIQPNIIKDSINIVSNSLKTAADTTKLINEITFDPTRIIDNNGILISVVGYVVVFVSLLLLYLVFTRVTKFLESGVRKRLKKSGKIVESEKEEISVSGEINAAISTALYLYFEEIHDYENTVLTIKKVQRPYSPWSSKIYGLREFPKRK